MSEDNIIHGPPSTIPPITGSAGTFIYRCLLEHIEIGTLFVDEVTGQRITYKDFLQYSCSLANSLETYGITIDNLAVICCENCVEYFVPVVACMYRGIPVIPINPLYTESEFVHAFNLINPEIVFCSVKTVNKMLHLKKRFTNIKTIIIINSNKEISNVWNLTSFVRQYSGYIDIHNYRPLEINDIKNHIAFIMFSSGTTGLPKGVMITHQNVNVKNATFQEPSINVSDEVRSQHTLGFLPFFHAFGLQYAITAMMQGRTIVVFEKFDFELYLKCIAKYKITTLSGAPPIMQMLAKSPIVGKYDLSHVEQIIVGAGPISRSLEETVKKRTGIKQIGQGYGLTETTLALSFTPIGVEKHGSCGKLLPNLSAVVKDLKTGRNLGPHQDGELCFKGGVIMKGYYENDTANKETFTEDGFLRSGDVGHYDEEGYFYIVDRLKELIKYKGYQVAPAELEGVLMTNPKIKDAGVIGLPDADAGELPIAFIVKQPNAHLTQDEVVDFVKKFVAPSKYLRGGVVFIEEIPRNPSGKILRRELRQMLKAYKSKL